MRHRERLINSIESGAAMPEGGAVECSGLMNERRVEWSDCSSGLLTGIGRLQVAVAMNYTRGSK